MCADDATIVSAHYSVDMLYSQANTKSKDLYYWFCLMAWPYDETEAKYPHYDETDAKYPHCDETEARYPHYGETEAKYPHYDLTEA